jgi:hypothetical protein
MESRDGSVVLWEEESRKGLLAEQVEKVCSGWNSVRKGKAKTNLEDEK